MSPYVNIAIGALVVIAAIGFLIFGGRDKKKRGIEAEYERIANDEKKRP